MTPDQIRERAAADKVIAQWRDEFDTHVRPPMAAAWSELGNRIASAIHEVTAAKDAEIDKAYKLARMLTIRGDQKIAERDVALRDLAAAREEVGRLKEIIKPPPILHDERPLAEIFKECGFAWTEDAERQRSTLEHIARMVCYWRSRSGCDQTAEAKESRFKSLQTLVAVMRRKVKNFRKDAAQYKRTHDASEWFRRCDDIRTLKHDLQTAQSEVASLREQVATLTRERDEAVDVERRMKADWLSEVNSLNNKIRCLRECAEKAEAERDRLAKVLEDRSNQGMREADRANSRAKAAERIAAASAAQVTRMRETLQSIEYITSAHGEQCPSCNGYLPPGHFPDCRLAAALSEQTPATPQPSEPAKEKTMGYFHTCGQCGKRYDRAAAAFSCCTEQGGESASEREQCKRCKRPLATVEDIRKQPVPDNMCWTGYMIRDPQAAEECLKYSKINEFAAELEAKATPTSCSGCGDRGGWEDGDEGQWVVCLKCKPRSENESHMGTQAGIRASDSLGTEIRPGINASMGRPMDRSSVELEGVKATPASERIGPTIRASYCEDRDVVLGQASPAPLPDLGEVARLAYIKSGSYAGSWSFVGQAVAKVVAADSQRKLTEAVELLRDLEWSGHSGIAGDRHRWCPCCCVEPSKHSGSCRLAAFLSHFPTVAEPKKE